MKKSSIVALLMSCAMIAGCKSSGSGYNTGSGSSATDTGTTHIHTPGSDYHSDGNTHWKECECGQKLEEALHEYNQEVVDAKYLASDADCTSPAKYYKSCVCGRAGTETFDSGVALEHTSTKPYNHDPDHHWKCCEVCGTVFGYEEHNFTVKTTTVYEEANCQHGTKYYLACEECGVTSAEHVWEDNDGGVHNYSTAWSYDYFNHWHECNDCGQHTGGGAHDFGGYSTSRTVGDALGTIVSKCEDCERTITFAPDLSVTFTLNVTKYPTYTEGGQLTLVGTKGDETSTYVFSLPSLADDLAADDHIYTYISEYQGDYNGTNYRFRISSLNTYCDIIKNNLESEDDQIGLLDYQLIPVFHEYIHTMGDFIATATYGGEKAYFVVDTVFKITGRGTFAGGQLLGGTLANGDNITLYNTDGTTKSSQVTAIGVGQTVYTSISSSEAAGQSVSLCLRGLETTDLAKGTVITLASESFSYETKALATVRFLTKSEGGRHTPMTNGYKPQIYIGSTDITGTITNKGTESMMIPGSVYDIGIELITGAIFAPGTPFAVREGGRVIAYGYITGVVSAGSTELVLGGESNWHGEPTYALDFTDESAKRILVNKGDEVITLTDSDGDSGSYLPSFVYQEVVSNNEEDLEITIQVTLPNGSKWSAFVYSNYRNLGSITKVNGTTTLVLEGNPEECPTLFDSTGGWNYTAADELSIDVYVEFNTNVM